MWHMNTTESPKTPSKLLDIHQGKLEPVGRTSTSRLEASTGPSISFIPTQADLQALIKNYIRAISLDETIPMEQAKTKVVSHIQDFIVSSFNVFATADLSSEQRLVLYKAISSLLFGWVKEVEGNKPPTKPEVQNKL